MSRLQGGSGKKKYIQVPLARAWGQLSPIPTYFLNSIPIFRIPSNPRLGVPSVYLNTPLRSQLRFPLSTDPHPTTITYTTITRSRKPPTQQPPPTTKPTRCAAKIHLDTANVTTSSGLTKTSVASPTVSTPAKSPARCAATRLRPAASAPAAAGGGLPVLAVGKL